MDTPFKLNKMNKKAQTIFKYGFLLLGFIFILLIASATAGIFDFDKIFSSKVSLNSESVISSSVSSLRVSRIDGIEKFLFYNVNPYYNDEGNIIVEADINQTVVNFLRDAYQNPTVGKCRIIQNYLNGTAAQDWNCTTIQTYVTERISNGWKTFKNGVESGRINVSEGHITVIFPEENGFFE